MKNRQDLADATLREPTGFVQAVKVWLRHKVRVVAFAITPLRKMLEPDQIQFDENKAKWDGLMSDKRFSTYLGGTINVDGANMVTSLLLKFHAIDQPAILDVGCSGGTLVNTVFSFSKYLGTDVSSIAIEAAKQTVVETLADRANDIELETIDLRQFVPTSNFDAIIFNEVLYYLKSEQAVHEVCRIARNLNQNGIVVISMKDDGKSRVIFSKLLDHFKWVDGILWQRKTMTYDYAIRPNRERPAFLVAALQPRD